MADNRPNVYWENNKLIIRASSFGGCIRSLIQTGMGVTPVVGGNNYLAKAFAEGTRAEPLIVERLNEQGHTLIGTGEDQLEMELKVGPVIIRCHPDGIALGAEPDRVRVVEIKALKPSFPRDFQPYLWQASIEMLAAKMPLMWVYGTKDESGVVDLDKLDIVQVDEPYFDLVAVKKRALAIYQGITKSNIPECDYRQFPCGFWTDPEAACAKRNDEQVDDLGLSDDLVRRFVVAKGVKDDAEADFKEVSNLIRKILEDRGGERYKSGNLRMVKVSGAKRFSKARADKLGIDLSDAMIDSKSYWRIDVMDDDETESAE